MAYEATRAESQPSPAGPVRAVLLDALGTLVELRPPAPRLRRRLAEAGFEVSEERAAAGIGAEIAYYLANHLDGSDRDSLEGLRDRCATAMMDALELPGLDHATARTAMMDALEFVPFAEVPIALKALRAAGHKLVVVSNWDCSLPDWLGPPGLLEMVDGVVTSADVGRAKPDPEIFVRGLELAGVSASEAVHVGDSVDNDLRGALAAGMRAVLVQREGPPPPGVDSVRTLAEVPALLSGQ
jgi:putative hydrolase of the HAD superfamily